MGSFLTPTPPLQRMQCSAPQQNQPDHSPALRHFCHTICPSLFIAQLLFISGVRGRYCLIPQYLVQYIRVKTEFRDTFQLLAEVWPALGISFLLCPSLFIAQLLFISSDRGRYWVNPLYLVLHSKSKEF